MDKSVLRSGTMGPEYLGGIDERLGPGCRWYMLGWWEGVGLDRVGLV